MVEKILLLIFDVQERLDLIINYDTERQSWKILVVPVRARQFLPQIYVPSQDILPKVNKCMTKVNMQRKIRSAGSFSCLVLELKRIIKHKRWNLTWTDMCLILFG